MFHRSPTASCPPLNAMKAGRGHGHRFGVWGVRLWRGTGGAWSEHPLELEAQRHFSTLIYPFVLWEDEDTQTTFPAKSLKTACPDTGGETEAGKEEGRSSSLQAVLLASPKYQAPRLRTWLTLSAECSASEQRPCYSSTSPPCAGAN